MPARIIAEAGYEAPDLVSRLKVRVEQLEDAFATFHDLDLSDERAARILAQVFPE